ncbi:MAG: CHAT domain-containing protein, partial [Pseudomonadota bacterium]|nr:CHAT domain-containing protein [Pseudomonadota bacterium]
DALSKLVRLEQDLGGELAKLEAANLAEVAKEPARRDRHAERAIHDRVREVRDELRQVRNRLSVEFPKYVELQKPQAVSLAQVRSLLNGDEALIVIDIAGEDEGADYVWAISRERSNWQRMDTEPGQIARLIAELRNGLDLQARGRKPIEPNNSYELFRLMLAPVEDVLADNKHLLFVLNGAVSSLPPQILVTALPSGNTELRDAAWLARKYSISILPTVSSLKLLREQGRQMKALKPFRGYGDPVFDPVRESNIRMPPRGFGSLFRGGRADLALLRENLPRLPGTAKELQTVARKLAVPDSEIILRGAASEAAVKQDDLSDYSIVYFATHGLVAGEVEQVAKGTAEPALALTIPSEATDIDDGLLTVSEIVQLRLNADWVVLSACNTAAAGKPGANPLSGLARAFFYAGARSLLVSHWVVDDESTAELMGRTFTYAAEHTDSHQAEALQHAMLSLIDDPDHPHWSDPIYWAPFVIVGESFH